MTCQKKQLLYKWRD